MRKKVKRILALLLAIGLAVSVTSGIALSASSEEGADPASSVTEEVEEPAGDKSDTGDTGGTNDTKDEQTGDSSNEGKSDVQDDDNSGSSSDGQDQTATQSKTKAASAQNEQGTTYDWWDPPSGSGGGSGSSTSSSSVDHIDIGVDLTATVVINGVEKDVKFTIGTSDAQYVTITAAKGDGTTVTFDRTGVSTSTDNAGNQQIRIEGSFPVGTRSDPVYYTVTLSKTITVTVDGVSYQVPVTLTVTTHYWSTGNVCPGLGTDWQTSDRPSGNSGIDLKLNNGSGSTATVGTLSIQKTVEGYELTADKTYTFEIYSVSADGVETKYGNDVTVTVSAGQTMATVMLTQVPFGTYKVVEKETGKDITGYTCTTTYTTGQSKTISKEDLSETFAVTNSYEWAQVDEPDATYIKVQKDFSGLDTSTLTALSETFSIQLYSDSACTNLVATLNLKNATTVSGTTYTWTVPNLEAGTYYVKENGQTVQDFEVETKANGAPLSLDSSVAVTTKASNIGLTATGTVTSCNKTEFEIGTNVTFIVAKLTENYGYFVWTQTTLSANSRAAVINWINDLNGYGGGATSSNTYFYSGDKIADANGLNFRGGNVRFDKDTGYLYFTAKNQWSRFTYGTYTFTGGENPEILITNTYTRVTNDLTIQKAVEGIEASAVANTVFEFNIVGPENVNGTYSGVTFTDGKATVTITGVSSKVIESLPVGSYVVTETTPTDPEGYTFDTSTVKTGTATLTADSADRVVITNKYHKNPKVTVLKDVTGNMGDTDKSFAFTATGVTNGFELKDKDQNPNSKQEITVPYGSKFVVTETEAGQNGYTTTASDNKTAGSYANGTYAIDSVTADVTITFVNEKNVTVPNGLNHTITPYIIMVAVAAGAGVYFVMRRRPRGRHCR